MAFPKTKTELEEQGYIFESESACKGCGRWLHWYKTPKGKSMPMEVTQLFEEVTPTGLRVRTLASSGEDDAIPLRL